MLEIEQIKEFYPSNRSIAERNMLREYLQYKILSIIFASKYGAKLSFMGGTAIRIVYKGTRFSEDLDFDNFGLTDNEFDDLTVIVKDRLEEEALQVELKNVHRGAYRCYLKIPGILFDYGLSGHREEKILVQLDTTPHKVQFQPELHIINKFGVFAEIRVNPSSILLAQKFDALLNRKRIMGRDMFDIVYLSSLSKPDIPYIQKKMGYGDFDELKEAVLKRVKKYDLDELSEDILPFVSESDRLEVIRKFDRWLLTYSI